MGKFLKTVLPPFLYAWLYHSPLKKYGWFGDYSTWEDATRASKGYDSDVILEKVKEASLKVKNGEFPYERDSKLCNKIEYDWPVLTGLLWVAAQKKGKLNVIDFGGSLGSTYRQNLKFLKDLDVQWNIIEQSKFVDSGRKHFQDERLKFYYDLPSCLKENQPDVVLLASVLSYVKEPYELLSSVLRLRITYLIIDRIPFIKRSTDRLTVQTISPDIYAASYPSWFFGKEKFMIFLKEHYEIIEEYDCGFKLNLRSELKGLILKLK